MTTKAKDAPAVAPADGPPAEAAPALAMEQVPPAEQAARQREIAALQARIDALRSGVRVRTFVVSEGVRGELATHGRSVDPTTGGVFRLDRDTGDVTLTLGASGWTKDGDPIGGAVSTVGRMDNDGILS